MDPMKPNLDDLQRAFAVTSLEPEIPEETLIAYASGRATDLEKELVETMLEVDPTLAEVVATIREELARVNEPLPARPSASPEPKKTRWWRAWFPGAVALAACGALVFGLVGYDRALQEERSKDRRLASEIEANQERVADLQRSIEALGQRLSSAGTDKQRLVAELEQARNTLKRELASQRRPSEIPSSVESLVARALTRGLPMPPPVADLSVSRGEADLPVSRSPNRTSVRLPVRLTWSDAHQPEYQVEITKDGATIWRAKVTRPAANPPSSLLNPGVVYSWRVESGDKHSLDAVFRVCSRKEEIQASRVAEDRTLGPLEKGVVFASLGLVPEAKAQFELLRASHPALAERLTKEIENAQE